MTTQLLCVCVRACESVGASLCDDCERCMSGHFCESSRVLYLYHLCNKRCLSLVSLCTKSAPNPLSVSPSSHHQLWILLLTHTHTCFRGPLIYDMYRLHMGRSFAVACRRTSTNQTHVVTFLAIALTASRQLRGGVKGLWHGVLF